MASLKREIKVDILYRFYEMKIWYQGNILELSYEDFCELEMLYLQEDDWTQPLIKLGLVVSDVDININTIADGYRLSRGDGLDLRILNAAFKSIENSSNKNGKPYENIILARSGMNELFRIEGNYQEEEEEFNKRVIQWETDKLEKKLKREKDKKAKAKADRKAEILSRFSDEEIKILRIRK